MQFAEDESSYSLLNAVHFSGAQSLAPLQVGVSHTIEKALSFYPITLRNEQILVLLSSLIFITTNY